MFKCDTALRQRCSNIVQAAVTEEAMEQGQHIDRGRAEPPRSRSARPTALGALRALIARRGKNRAAVALANKNARIVWALLVHHQEYRAKTAAKAAGSLLSSRIMLSDPRCMTELMTRWVRPASPDSALQHGLRGRGNNEEEKRAFHQGPKALTGLQSKAGYMPASVLFRVSVQPLLGIGGGSI